MKHALSPRELEVAELLAWGASKKEVSERLSISVRTVENTSRIIYRKLGIQKATELTVWWMETRYGIPSEDNPLKRVLLVIVMLSLVCYYDYNNVGDGAMRASKRAKVEVVRKGGKNEFEI